MLEIVQQKDGIVGAKNAIKLLAKKENPRLLVISDSHGRYTILRAIVLRYGSTCDALVFCGDGAYDLARLLDESRTDSAVNAALPPVLAFVQGNGDSSVITAGDAQDRIRIPQNVILTAGRHQLFVTHGHRESVGFDMGILANVARSQGCSVALYGHTHVPGESRFPHCTLINGGSCALPRAGSPNSCAIVTVTQGYADTAFIKIKNPGCENPDFELYVPQFLA